MPSIDASKVIDRMIEAAELNNDRDLARYLDRAPSTISSWRQRGSVPYEECVRIAIECRVSLDWLVCGQEPLDIYPGLFESGMDIELLTLLLYHQYEKKRFESVLDPWNRAKLRARTLIGDYMRYKEMLDQEVSKHGVSREAFISHVKRALDLLEPDSENE
ncbi:MAG: helix-turn-helix domain-containing protein [Sphingomonadales bacterium]